MLKDQRWPMAASLPFLITLHSPAADREGGLASDCFFHRLGLWALLTIPALKRGIEMLHSPTRDVVTMNEVVPIEMRKESHQTALFCWLSCLCSEFQQHMVVLLVHGAAVAFVKPSQR